MQLQKSLLLLPLVALGVVSLPTKGKEIGHLVHLILVSFWSSNP